MNFIHTFFGDSHGIDIEELSHFCQVRSVKRGEFLFHEGDKGEHCYFLYDGMVRLSKVNNEGREVTIHIVQSGEIFAEALLHLDSLYPVSAYIIKESRLLAINIQKMFRFIELHPPFAMKFIAQLIGRLKDLTRKIEEFTLMDCKSRLHSYLMMLAKKQNRRTVRLEFSKREIAMLLGTNPETISRMLSNLEHDGLIRVAGKDIELLNR